MSCANASVYQRDIRFEDRKHGAKSSFVYNLEPSGPVDFVLIAMEPSTGVPGEADPELTDPAKKKDMNFVWSAEDFIFHYCIRNYLCGSKQTYHPSDLSKGSMTVRDAGAERERRYERWFPLLEEELRLVAKPGETRVIAIGNVVEDFLQDRNLCRRMQSVLHYTRTAAGHRKRKVDECWTARYGEEASGKWTSRFNEFCEGIDGDEFEETVRSVVEEAKMDEAVIYHRLKGPGSKSGLTTSRRMLMFYYKLRFEELRCSEDIVFRLDERQR